ncbi:MAG TPA: DUF4189 domain-containing protein [Alphaproteobacteria bacterium]|jgi:hypothetical protein
MKRSLLPIAAAAALVLAPAGAYAQAQGEWGALALSERSTAYGYSYDFDSQDGATGRALAECSKNAGDCRVHTTFRNTCLVLAGSVDGPFGWAWGGAEATRTQRALEQCRQRGAINCKVVETVCTGTAGGPARPRNPARAPQPAPPTSTPATSPPASTPGAPTQLHKQ